MDKSLTVIIGAVFGITMLIAVGDMAKAATPTPQFVCPICSELFFTYDELYQHFTVEHPSSPIDIIWE